MTSPKLLPEDCRSLLAGELRRFTRIQLPADVRSTIGAACTELEAAWARIAELEAALAPTPKAKKPRQPRSSKPAKPRTFKSMSAVRENFA